MLNVGISSLEKKFLQKTIANMANSSKSIPSKTSKCSNKNTQKQFYTYIVLHIYIVLIAQSDRASEQYSVVVGSNPTQVIFL